MNTVRIRMYRQGLGDCFLLTFPRTRRNAHVLIDCGVLKGSENAQAAMRKVAANIVETTAGRLDVLAVTHEHWDHVSGFLQAADVLKELKIGQVWMSWTENRRDRRARELGRRRARALKSVAAAARRLHIVTGPGAGEASRRLDSLLGFHGGLDAAAQQTTARAMEWARTGTGGDVRYCSPGDDPLEVPGVTGVRVFVLGPPRDVKLIRKNNPGKRDSEVYELAATGEANLGLFAALEAMDTGHADDLQPFDEWFRLTGSEAAGDGFFSSRYHAEAEEWRNIEHDWFGAATRLALQLDADTNNTSLVLAFELTKSGRVLLFPGDAQVGNWLSWQPLKWNVRYKGKPVTARDLLARTVLYKVGHHGSHNATLRQKGLEMMSSGDLAAMIPVFRPTARKLEWNMPFPSLFRRLDTKTQGRILDLESGVKPTGPSSISPAEWKRFLRRTEVNEDWLDYHIPI